MPDDLIDFTPQLRAEALERLKRFKVDPSPFAPPILGNVNGIVGSIGAGTATNWPGGGYDPELHIVFAPAGNTPSNGRSIVEPPPGFSDIKYVSGVAGRRFQEVIGPGDCCAADSPRTAQRAREARALGSFLRVLRGYRLVSFVASACPSHGRIKCESPNSCQRYPRSMASR